MSYIADDRVQQEYVPSESDNQHKSSFLSLNASSQTLSS